MNEENKYDEVIKLQPGYMLVDACVLDDGTIHPQQYNDWRSKWLRNPNCHPASDEFMLRNDAKPVGETIIGNGVRDDSRYPIFATSDIIATRERFVEPRREVYQEHNTSNYWFARLYDSKGIATNQHEIWKTKEEAEANAPGLVAKRSFVPPINEMTGEIAHPSWWKIF